MRQVSTKMSLCATLVMWAVLAAFSLYKPALCKQPVLQWGSLWLGKIWCFPSCMRALLWTPFPGALWDPHWFWGVPGCSWAVPLGGFGCLGCSLWHWGAAAADLVCASHLSAAVLGVGNPPLLSSLCLTAGRGGQIAFVNNFSNGKTRPEFSAMNRPLLSVVWITAILLF